jgi:hypothetical protein
MKIRAIENLTLGHLNRYSAEIQTGDHSILRKAGAGYKHYPHKADDKHCDSQSAKPAYATDHFELLASFGDIFPFYPSSAMPPQKFRRFAKEEYFINKTASTSNRRETHRETLWGLRIYIEMC